MKIFEYITDDFETNGLGQIIPLKCIETKRKSLNGWSLECEVELKYLEMIQKDNIIVVETKEKGSQPFFINEPTINKTVTFTADHIVFSCQRYMLSDVRPTNLNGYDFLEWCNKRTDTASPFHIFSNIPTKKTAYFIRKNFLEVLEETELLFDGVFDIDGFNVNFLSTIGKMSDETLVYGKNIDEMKIYEKWDVCTKILPLGPDELMLPEVYITSDVTYKTPYTKTVTFDIDKEKEDGTQKTEAEMIVELRTLANQYLDINKYPKINYTVSANVPQNLCVGDIVPVKHPLANIETDVQSYTYDVAQKKVTSIEYGNYERNVKKEFQSIKSEIKEVSKKTDNFLTQAKDEVYYLMNVAGKNGSVVFRKNDDNVIYEILAMDSKDIETAKVMMRINSQGVAGTDKGINGAFNTAIMANGTILADMIKAGTLRAIDIDGVNINGSVIKGGTISGGSILGASIKGNSIEGGTMYGSNINGSSIVGSTLTSQSDIMTVSISNGKISFLYKNSVWSEFYSGVEITQGDDITGKGSLHSTSSIYTEAQLNCNGNLYSNKNAQISQNCYARNFQQISDIRRKENIEDANLVEIYRHLNVKKFNYIGSSEKSVGVIAQSFVGTEYEDILLRKDCYGFYTVNYNVFLMASIQIIQKQQKQLDDLINALKEKGVLE